MAGKQKLSDEDREEIRRLHKEEGLSYANLAEIYKVNYRTISRVCNPDKYEQQKQKNLEYNKKNMQKIVRTRKANNREYFLRLSKAKDGRMINHLDSKDNVNGYLKSIIQKDMDENSEGTPPKPLAVRWIDSKTNTSTSE